MDWIDDESIRLCSPSFADELVGREPFEGLQSAAEIIGVDEVLEMAAQLVVVVIVEAFDGCFLDGSVHALDLSVGPGMLDLGEPVLDLMLAADTVEDVVEGIAMPFLVGELDASPHRTLSVSTVWMA